MSKVIIGASTPSGNRTESQALSLAAAKKLCLQKTGMNETEYNKLLFDYGCKFAEGNELYRGLGQVWLTDKSVGYWSWFKFHWLLVDKAIAGVEELSKEDYKISKDIWVQSDDCKKEFSAFLLRV